MRVVFLGSPAPAVPSLRALVAGGHDVLGVVTQPDKRRGRGSALTGTPVSEAAKELGLPVWHDLEAVERVDADLAVVVAYGRLIPERLLAALPMINVHFSLLPRWRGAAPVERAILEGDAETGVCVMGLEASLDTGPIFASATTLVGEKTSAELLDELAQMGASLLLDVVGGPSLPTPTPQVGTPTYAAKLTPLDFALRPEDSAEQLGRVVRLGRAVAAVGGKRCRILSATVVADEPGSGVLAPRPEGVLFGAARGSLLVTELQMEGSRPMRAADWWRGARWNEPATWSLYASETLG